MTKIVVTNDQDFTDEQKKRLESLGEVKYYDELPINGEEYLERVKGADIICSGAAGLKDAFSKLKDVYITVAFVSVAFVDLDVLRKNNVTLSNAPGVNRFAVSEWIMCMVTLLARGLYDTINREETYRKGGNLPPITLGLKNSKITILGQGNIGKRVGELASEYGMDVKYYKRGDDLYKTVENADVVVDALSSNPSTEKLLDERFFSSMKKGSYFVTVTRSEIVDDDAMIRALDNGILAGVATDCGGILVGDTEDSLYRKMKAHPKILATPHTSYNSHMSMKLGADSMIDNVEAWIHGQPRNVVT